MKNTTDISKHINLKTMESKYANAIIEGLKEDYSSLYPGFKINVEKDIQNQLNGFSVYVNGFKILDKNKQVKTEKVFLKFYTNFEAINFSKTFTSEEIQKQCNDYSYDNHKWLEEQINALLLMYKLNNNLKILTAKVEDHCVKVKCNKFDHPENVYYGDDFRFEKFFNVSPISKSNAKNIFNKISDQLKHYIERSI